MSLENKEQNEICDLCDSVEPDQHCIDCQILEKEKTEDGMGFLQNIYRNRKSIYITSILFIYYIKLEDFKKFFWYLEKEDMTTWIQQVLLAWSIPLVFYAMGTMMFTDDKRQNPLNVLLVWFAGIPMMVWAFDMEDWLLLDVIRINEIMSIRAVGLETYSYYYMFAIAFTEELIKMLVMAAFLLLYHKEHKGLATLGVSAAFVAFEGMLYATQGDDIPRTWSILVRRFDGGAMTLHMATGMSVLLILYLMETPLFKSEKYLWVVFPIFFFILNTYIHLIFNVNALISAYGVHETFIDPAIIAWVYIVILAFATYLARYLIFLDRQKKFEGNLLT
ncbi:hypothetical protein LCGC14_0194770 [marine sediment metagenome]|uniref:PrsW family intramembrane metalloprotease n=1 Tax=marine sediment metagenome TaxID=412755 RepID=A0A0F9UK65_9ZZZZ